MNSHECALAVYLLPNSLCEAKRLIEEWVYHEGHFQPPIRISVSIDTDNAIVTSLLVKWIWDYDLADSMKRTIGIGLAIALNIKLYNLSRSFGFKWSPSTPTEVYNTFSNLLTLIPSLRKHIIIVKK